MPTLRLSDVGLQSLKAERLTDFWDATLPSFGVRVSPLGTKTFVVKAYNGRRSVGRYPAVTLSAARKEAKRLLAEKTLSRIRPEAITYEQASKAFLEDAARKNRPGTVSEYRRLLERLGFKGQLATVTPAEVNRKLSLISYESERFHVIVAGKILFNWAMKRYYVTYNPFIGAVAKKSTPRTRILTDDELKSIWRACSQTGDKQTTGNGGDAGTLEARTPVTLNPRLPESFARIVQLLILTGQRRGEIAQLHTSWLDAENKTITIPAMISKNGREHCIPILDTSKDIIQPLVKSGTTFLFLARGSTGRPFNGWSKSKVALDKLSGVTGWTLHDIRRTVATRMAERGVAPHIIERILNHASGQISGVALIYNRASYLAEMRNALALWENRLTAILSHGQDGAPCAIVLHPHNA